MGSSLNRSLIQYYLDEKEMSETNPTRFAAERGPLLGWLLVFMCKTDSDTVTLRGKVGDTIDAGLVDEATGYDCGVVIYVIASKIFALYSSMVLRRLFDAARFLIICFSAVLVAWMLSYFARGNECMHAWYNQSTTHPPPAVVAGTVRHG